MTDELMNQRLIKLEDRCQKIENEQEKEIDMLTEISYQLKESVALLRQKINALINGLIIVGTPVICIIVKLLFDDVK